MSKSKNAIALAFAGFVAITSAAYAALPFADSQETPLPTLAPMVERTMPAVVNVFSRARIPVERNPMLSDPFFRRFFNVPEQPRERQAQSLGSGVIVDANHGYILTNHHVVAEADEISVQLSDGRNLTARLVGSDSETDIALLQVDDTSGLVALPFANSDQLRVGDFVVAIGNPFGLGHSVTSGIVSGLGRSGLGIEGYEDFIQTDASINPGNSGGALVNLRGELVGVNTAILSKSGGNMGIGFAIPINMARNILNQLSEFGEVQRGRLGVSVQNLTPDLARAFGITDRHGAVVTQVEPGSAAERAGLQSGDIVLEVNGQAVQSAADLRNVVGLMRVGEEVTLKVQRGSEQRTLSTKVKAPQLTQVEGEKIHPRFAGAALGNIVEGMPEFGRLHGVVVTAVDRRSPAAVAGLRPGDIITQANRRSVQDIDGLRQAVQGSGNLLLNVQRGGGAFYILLQ